VEPGDAFPTPSGGYYQLPPLPSWTAFRIDSQDRERRRAMALAYIATFPRPVEAWWGEVTEEHPRTIVTAILTCDACPTQWDAWDAEGGYLYLRYRFGTGTAQSYPGPDFYDTRAPGRLVATFQRGEGMDGEITLAEFCELAGFGLALRTP
jgi:hypothetical protein